VCANEFSRLNQSSILRPVQVLLNKYAKLAVDKYGQRLLLLEKMVKLSINPIKLRGVNI